jgi:glycosyltransferase involved in cell wall biosynthesis
MEKIKILMVPSDSQGVGHFRSIWPAQTLTKHFGNEFEVEINLAPNVENLEYLKSFDIIHFHRHLGPYELMDKTFADLKAAGVILIMDIDDFWEPPTTHPLFQIVKTEKLSEKIIKTIKLADYVTTTTDIFAAQIKKYNQNVIVMPNAIDMNDKMWKSETVPNETDKCRISWIGGSSHLHDLKLLEHSMNLLHTNKALENKFQIIMCGFDTRGSITELGPNNQRNTRAILPHETIWLKFEEIFTNDYSDTKKDAEYFKWLMKIKKEDYPGQYTKNYVRRWTLPLTQYGKHYDFCDVCLAPIAEVDRFKEIKLQNGEREIVPEEDPRPGTVMSRRHYFNEVKSELKIIEAGMKKKCLIAQDFGIYKQLLKNGETGILINDNKDGWFKAIRKVVQEPEYREMLANNLHEYVKEKYELKNATSERAAAYKDILSKKKGSKIILETSLNGSSI